MTDHLPASGTPRLPRGSRTAAAALLIALAAAACVPHRASVPPATAGPSGGPTTGPLPSPTTETGGLEHPTGATDVVFRVEEVGGMQIVEFAATAAPSFTLYGDGTVVFRDPYAAPPEPVGNAQRAVPFQIARLGEAGVQALLQEALGPGGLAMAAGPYTGMLADVPTTTFSINLVGESKTVEVTGLSPDSHPQDALIIGQLAAFHERLRTFADDVPGEQPYIPAAYRGVLLPVEQPFGPVVDWPWTDIEPDDFVADENEFFHNRVMTPDEVAAIGVADVAGGLMGAALEKDGKVYTFSLRPLLPDEDA